MKRVLFIAPQPFFSVRGTPMNVREFTRCLGELTLDVDLLVYPHGDDVALTGVRIRRCPELPLVKHVPIGFSIQKVLYDCLLFIHAFLLCIRHRYTVIHGVEEAGIIAGILGSIFNIPYVMDFDSCVEDELRRTDIPFSNLAANLFAKFQSVFIKRAKLIVTVAPYLTDYIRDICPSATIAQIEDCPLETPAVSERTNGALEFPASKTVMLYTGNFETYQGLDLLFESLEKANKLQAELSNRLQVVLVGGEPKQIAEYSAKASKLGISSLLQFLGLRPTHEMYDLMNKADFLVSPRLVGINTPLKIYTYMQSGKPIIATSIAAHTGILSDSVAFMSAAEPGPFSALILEAIRLHEENSTEPKLRAAAALDLLERRFSREAFRNKVANAYRAILPSQIEVPQANAMSAELSSEVSEIK